MICSFIILPASASIPPLTKPSYHSGLCLACTPSVSSPPPTTSTSSPVLCDDLSIALCKGKRQCTHPISSFCSYNYFSSHSCSFIASLDSISLPNKVSEALAHSGWRSDMIEDMDDLTDNGTLDFVHLPFGKKDIGCRRVFTVKVNPNGSIVRLKARLIVKGYAQTYGVDYSETFSPIAKLTSIRLLISLAATHGWDLHQLDFKNAFLHGDLVEEVYMEEPLGFVS